MTEMDLEPYEEPLHCIGEWVAASSLFADASILPESAASPELSAGFHFVECHSRALCRPAHAQHGSDLSRLVDHSEPSPLAVLYNQMLLKVLALLSLRLAGVIGRYITFGKNLPFARLGSRIRRYLIA